MNGFLPCNAKVVIPVLFNIFYVEKCFNRFGKINSMLSFIYLLSPIYRRPVTTGFHDFGQVTTIDEFS
jgi:hypothetical protein